MVTPLWPAMIEAASRHDVKWVRRTLHRALWSAFGITAVGGTFMFFAITPIAKYWTHGQVHPSTLLLVSLTLWTIVGGIGTVTAMFMNAMNVIRFQLIVASMAALLNLALSIWLTRRIGAVGVVLGSTISVAIFIIPVFTYVIPNVFGKLDQQAAKGQPTEEKKPGEEAVIATLI
jgi:O-antigen/teichoic acid export membrane protein